MKRSILTLSIFLLGIVSASSQSITITSPRTGDNWKAGKKHDITWRKSGDMKGPVKIRLYDEKGRTKIHDIVNKTLNNGSYEWTIPGSIAVGKYRIRVKTINNAVGGDSNIFNINIKGSNIIVNVAEYKNNLNTIIPELLKNKPGSFPPGKKIKFHSPKTGYIWKPLKNYDVSFEVLKENLPITNYYFDIKLVPANPIPGFQDIYLKKNYRSTKGTGNSYFYAFQWKFLGSYNILSGKYKIVVQSVYSPNLRAESEFFDIQRTFGDKVTFLTESEGTLKLEDVLYDRAKKGIYASVRNVGYAPYNGNISVGYYITLGSLAYNSCPIGRKFENTADFNNVNLNLQENKVFKLLDLKNCFDIRPGEFTFRSSPIKYSVWLFSNSKKLGTKTGWICNSNKPEILASSPFFIITKDNKSVWVHHKQKDTINPDHFNWISKTRFKASVGVNVGNNGCSPKTFEITLTMNGPYLNGSRSIKLGTITLAIGQRKRFVSQPIVFSIPKGLKYERILLVANPGEVSDEGYPNAYMNNFVLGNIRIHAEGVHVEGVL